RVPDVPFREKVAGLVYLLPMVILLLLVIGTIYAGIATATESAAFGVTGAFLMALLSRRMTLSKLREALIVPSTTTAMTMFTLVGASVVQFLRAVLGTPAALSRWIAELGLAPRPRGLRVCARYVAGGSFRDALAMVVTTTPVLVPLFKSLGVDMAWFGVIVGNL